MKTVRIFVTLIARRGNIFILADTSHPEVDPLTTVDEADGLVLVCHPDDEQRLRDIIAVEQERPKWWRDQRRIEELMQRAVGDL